MLKDGSHDPTLKEVACNQRVQKSRVCCNSDSIRIVKQQNDGHKEFGESLLKWES